MPAGISHIALVVRDPERTAHLLRALFPRDALPSNEEQRGHAGLTVNAGGVTFVLIKGEPAGSRTDDHIAFKVQKSELPKLAARLALLGVESRSSRAGTHATSLYFVDFDNHLFELHADAL